MRRRFLNNTYKNISGDISGYIDYFTIEALEDGLTAKLSANACEYCVDGGAWNTLSENTNTASINKGQILSFRGNLIHNFFDGIGTFTISKKCNLKGNIMSLLYGDDFIDKTDLTGKDCAFFHLFNYCTKIVDASNLILPATTLANSCYESMFEGCTSLITAPELPATTLAGRCYCNMFYGTNVLPDCSNIDFTKHNNGGLSGLFAGTKVTDNDLYNILPINPATGNYWLPATTLEGECYAYMFDGCTSLTTAPELPATTLTYRCYAYMFEGCTGLTVAPELPATTLEGECYAYMFDGCTSLITAPELPATTLTYRCYESMFYGTNVLPDCINIDFTKHNNGGLQGLFAGTKVTDNDLYNILPINPATGNYWLPATTLKGYDYAYMFEGCTSLTTAPELPATTLEVGCYECMFSGCSKLNYIKMLATDISTIHCLMGWVEYVSETGTFVKHPDMNTLESGYSGIPSGWTVVDNVESNLITFTITGVEYQAEEGMTWEEWVESEYNTLGLINYEYIDPETGEGLGYGVIRNPIIDKTLGWNCENTPELSGFGDEETYSEDEIKPNWNYFYMRW